MTIGRSQTLECVASQIFAFHYNFIRNRHKVNSAYLTGFNLGVNLRLNPPVLTLATHLLPNGVRLGHQTLDVMPLRSPVKHELLDLHLQLGVGPLQRAHLFQVVGQSVVQALHGLLLAGGEAEAIEGEAGAHQVESVAQGDGAGQRQPAGGGGRLGAKAASNISHGQAGEGRLAYGVAAQREGGGHGVGWTRLKRQLRQWDRFSDYSMKLFPLLGVDWLSFCVSLCAFSV